jgi:S1-C subfamily serine protease
MVKTIYQLSFEHNGFGGLRDQIVSVVQQTEDSIVRFQSYIPEHCPSSKVLGSVRQGTGILINSSGYILTVGYLVMEATEVQVILSDDSVEEADVIGVDFDSGLGLLRLNNPVDLPPLRLGDSARVTNGQLTLTIGASTGEQSRIVTNGRIASTEEFIGYWEYLIERALYVVPQNPAFGGSPLMNLEGEVIGVISLQLNQHQGMNLAIPIDLFYRIESELMKYGRVLSRPPKPWMGIYHAPYTRGIIVIDVVEDGPAEKAGLKKGDVITHINDVKITSEEHFLRQLWQNPIHSPFQVTFIRQSTHHSLRLWGIDRHEFYDVGGSEEYQ